MKLTRLFIFLALIIVGIEVINIGLNHLIGNSLFVYRLILLVLSFIFYKLFEPKIHRWIVPQKENQRLNINEIDDYSGYNDTQKLTIVTREMKKQIYDLHSLFEVSVNLTSILDYDRLIKSYLLSVIGQSKTSGVVILFPSNDNWQILKPAFSKGFSNKKLTKLEIPYNDPLIQNFKNKAIPVNLSDYIKKSKAEHWYQFYKIGIELFAPIIHKKQIIGIIALGKKINKEPFTQSEIEIFSLMTNIASVAIVNAKLYQKLEQISVTDELTGLYNYRFFKKQLDDELARAQRFKHFLSLVMLDVDNFKNYNDTLGHPAGDRVLKQMGQLLKNSARQSDIVSRYGGEEFCVILPEVGIEGAWHFSERLRRQVENYNFLKKEVQPLGKVTISLGAACYPDDAQISKDLLDKADVALYGAKYSGRNRVCLYSDTMKKKNR